MVEKQSCRGRTMSRAPFIGCDQSKGTPTKRLYEGRRMADTDHQHTPDEPQRSFVGIRKNAVCCLGVIYLKYPTWHTNPSVVAHT